MKDTQDHLQDLSNIREMMEKSTTFISLSGLSGIVAGICAIVGALIAYNRLYIIGPNGIQPDVSSASVLEFTIIALAVLFAALFFGFILTAKKAKRKGQSMWGSTSKRLLFNLAIPLITGGLFAIILTRHQQFIWVAPTLLIFYGLALLNASKYTLSDIRALGLFEIGLGLLSAWFIGNGLLFWTLGFGIMHIVYGTIMHFKYDRH